ncbi:MAG TPA: sigma-70 family RNA polymerase sigma factor [Pseudonocardiaceae bacterium]|nr:sigma-70 family RNA polymerase sigma factor [Pseudonocardiaceae bacterium]
MPDIEEVQALDDPWERMRRAHEQVVYHQTQGGEYARIRREAIEDLIGRKVKQADIARMLGVSSSRISRLLSSAPKVERALLGTGPVTISVGGKWEAAKEKPEAVVSRPMMRACTLLGSMCVDYELGLAAEDYEVVPPPGHVRLNRDNLIVMGSPRILPLVGQVLESDEHLAFGCGPDGWYLVDQDSDTPYRSPSDRGEAADYGYIGRLPRPDGRGTFLYLAGIHAMGTLGTVQYLVSNIEDLYREVKTHRWSTIVETRYNPADGTIVAAERVTPIHVVRQ